MSHVTESIFNGENVVIALAEVVALLKDRRQGYEGAISILLKGAHRGDEIWIRGDEAAAFQRAWCTYRHELENPPAKLDIKIEPPQLTERRDRAYPGDLSFSELQKMLNHHEAVVAATIANGFSAAEDRLQAIVAIKMAMRIARREASSDKRSDDQPRKPLTLLACAAFRILRAHIGRLDPSYVVRSHSKLT